MTRRRDIGWKATWLVGVLLVALSGACEPAWDGPALEAERPPQVVPGPEEPPLAPGEEPPVPVAPGSVSPHVQVLDSLAVSHAVSRAAGGLDLDGDPDTCAPRLTKFTWVLCEDGVDNAVAVLGDSIAPAFGYLFSNVLGLGLAFEHRTDHLTAAVVYDLALWPVHATQVLFSDSPMPYRVSPLVDEDEDETAAEPPWVLEGARVIGRTLTAGRFGSRHTVVLGGDGNRVPFELAIHALQLRATLDYDPAVPGRVVGMRGLLGGALRPHALFELVRAAMREGDVVPTQAYQITHFLQHFLPPDIDLSGDGVGEAYSFALEFHATGSEVDGVSAVALPIRFFQD